MLPLMVMARLGKTPAVGDEAYGGEATVESKLIGIGYRFHEKMGPARLQAASARFTDFY